ncbi:MAG: IS3 family transposase, partial [Ktedonobacterales bacterium]
MITQIQQAQSTRSIRALCGVVPVSRSWYYAAPAAHEQRVRRDADLRDAIEQVVLDFPGYGYRRVTYALQRLGWGVNHKRVLRVMRQEALL